MSRYTIGLDYGTLSGRAVLADAADGRVLATAVYEYPHAVMDRTLPSGATLHADWALQHPADYEQALLHIIPQVLAESGVRAEDVIGVGVDFTASTAMPVNAEGTPLCLLPQYENRPHAYVKLWKHHAAQRYANEMTRIARQRGEGWLDVYGGKVSSEWSLPKLWQVLDEDPEIYHAMDEWMEAGDYLVYLLTGRRSHSGSIAGYKAFYNKGNNAYPPQDYFAALDERLRTVMQDKFKTPVSPLGACAGGVSETMARRLGLIADTPVAVAHIDAHVGAAAVGITRPGQMLAILGTSTCHLCLGEKERAVPGICGAVADGILPGSYGYEAGQSCVGDGFAWFTHQMVPEKYYNEAKSRGMHIQQYLTSLAQTLRPGESGLMMLDWWNGNRSILTDYDLQGLMLGMTLQTRPEEIYRAMIEATAFGTRMIVDNFRAHGVAVEDFFATGGISRKNGMAMQIYADVLHMPVRVADTDQGPALGSAIFAAAAAGSARGGYDTVAQAVAHMASARYTVYHPDAGSAEIYDRLYAEYACLHDYFGRGENDVMKRLKRIRESALKQH